MRLCLNSILFYGYTTKWKKLYERCDQREKYHHIVYHTHNSVYFVYYYYSLELNRFTENNPARWLSVSKRNRTYLRVAIRGNFGFCRLYVYTNVYLGVEKSHLAVWLQWGCMWVCGAAGWARRGEKRQFSPNNVRIKKTFRRF